MRTVGNPQPLCLPALLERRTEGSEGHLLAVDGWSIVCPHQRGLELVVFCVVIIEETLDGPGHEHRVFLRVLGDQSFGFFEGLERVGQVVVVNVSPDQP